MPTIPVIISVKAAQQHVEVKPSFEIIEKGAAIKCLLCTFESWNPRDKKRCWCPKCKLLHHSRTEAIEALYELSANLRLLDEIDLKEMTSAKYKLDAAQDYLHQMPNDHQMREAFEKLQKEISRLEELSMKRLKNDLIYGYWNPLKP